MPLPETLTVPVAVPEEFNVTLLAVNAPRAKLGFPGSVKLTEYVTGPPVVIVVDGALIVTDGIVGSTLNVALGPAAGARLPARSAAVPVAREKPKVPVPVMLEMVTARVLPLPDTLTVPVAVPVVFNVTFATASVLEPKLASA